MTSPTYVPETRTSADADVESSATGEAGGPPERPHAPAYGPVDAALGFALFYYLVDRATPTVVAVLTEAMPGVPADLVGLWLAAVLWFVLVATAIDQVRRQLAALGVGREVDVRRQARYPATQGETRTLGYLAALIVGGLFAAWTFAPAIDTAVSLVRSVAALDAGAFVSAEVVVMVVFFLAYAVATHALDRLVVGGLRLALAE